MRQFFIITNDNFSTNFQCTYYERYRYKPNYQGRFHMHAFTEIFFVTDGCGYFCLKERKIPIQRGMIIINNNDIAHMESSHPNHELEYAILSIENLAFLSNNKRNPDRTLFFDFQKDYDIIFDFIRKIEWEWIQREPFWENALQTQFNSFILFILRSSNLQVIPYQSMKDPNPLADVHLYLTANYSENITLDKLANAFCMNKYYLAHMFKKLYGDSIIHTLTQIRCQEAKVLLKKTDYSIKDIAALVGFSSCSYFSKTYRDFFGETPLQTRNG